MIRCWPRTSGGRHQHERAPAVQKGADRTCSPSYLTVQAFDGVVGADSSPVLHGEVRVDESIGHAAVNAFGGLF